MIPTTKASSPSNILYMVLTSAIMWRANPYCNGSSRPTQAMSDHTISDMQRWHYSQDLGLGAYCYSAPSGTTDAGNWFAPFFPPWPIVLGILSWTPALTALGTFDPGYQVQVAQCEFIHIPSIWLISVRSSLIGSPLLA